MPSVSDKQARFMQAVAHNPEFAKKAGVPQSVGKDFAEADKVKVPKSRPDLQGINKQKTDHGSMNLFKKGGAMKESKAMAAKEVSFMKKKGAPKSMIKHEKAEMGEMCGGGKVKKMASGGMTSMKMKEMMGPRTMGKDVEAGSNKLTSFGQSKVQKRGMTKGKEMGVSGPAVGETKGKIGGFAKGGKIDGIAQKGKTRGKYC
jgi:hypothetical protein